MPPTHRCSCQNEDPDSPYPPGYDGCEVRRQPAPLGALVPIQAFASAVTADRDYVPLLERLVQSDAARGQATPEAAYLTYQRSAPLPAIEGRAASSAIDTIRDLYPTEADS